MTVLIFGMSVDTAANIGVAIGTVLMAIVTGIMVYFTYLSLQSSKEQLEIQRKQFTFQEITFEKDQILEQMDLVIKPLRAELTVEIEKMRAYPVNFRTPNKYSSLKFPIPNSKNFYIPNKNPGKITEQEIPLHYTILDVQKIHPEFLLKLKNRYYIYLQIASKITNIEKELESEVSREQLESLVKTYCHPRKELIDPDYNFWDEVIELYTYEDDMVDGILVPVSNNMYQVPVSQFIKKTIALLFDDIWNIDQINVDLIDKEIIYLSSDVRKEFIETKTDSDIWSLKEEINDLLKDLQNVDDSLKTMIECIISEYKEKYHLSAEQLA